MPAGLAKEVTMTYIKKYAKRFSLILVIFALSVVHLPGEENEKAKKAEEEPQKPIIEEIEVTGETPAQQPLSMVSLIKKKELDKVVPKNLGEAMNRASGVYVTEGAKNEADVKIRGLSSNRITLMYDGISIYEPYFNSFDLKSFTVVGIENIKVIKGTNSVLYGPNALGGVINVITERPTQPFFSLSANTGENATYFVSGYGGFSWDRFAFFANATLDQSDGFNWNQDGDRVLRDNSDYNRLNLSGKFYFYPSEHSEIMVQLLYHTAEYGIPTATEFVKQRYWRFKDWDRWQFNLGGTFPLFGKGLLKVRSYYVYHHNVLDDYKSDEFSLRRWESTYKNDALGAFIMGEYPIWDQNNLKFSLNISRSSVRTQDEIGAGWEEFDREVYSLALEDHLNLSEKWKLVAGVSIDYLVKTNEETETRANPIGGIKFTPHEWLDFHLSFARKSRFPSMKSLYSSSSGNPDLTSEIGSNYEIGFSYKRSIWLSGTLFFHHIVDMIQSYRGLDGYRNYLNIGEADIYGLEVEARKKTGVFDINLCYTFLKSTEEETEGPLDYTPESQFNAYLNIGEIKGFSLSLWGMAVSRSQAKMGKNPPFEIVEIPGFAILNVRLEKRIGKLILYVKVENLMDNNYFSEPGYPMKARTLSFGFRFDIRRS